MRIVLIDGKNALYRHHFANSHLAREDGHPTGALHGCLNALVGMGRKMPDAAFVWIWEGRGETWRHKMMNELPQLDSKEFPDSSDDEGDVNEDYVAQMTNDSMTFLGLSKPKRTRKEPVHRGYKAQRVKAHEEKKSKKEYPEDEHARAMLQMPILRLILEGMGFRQFEVNNLEGDDLLAMLAKHALKLDKECRVLIHSGDRDFYQMLKYARVKILSRLKQGKLEYVTREEVEAKYNVRVKDWARFRAWTGDTSDNIPHLFKIGPVRARTLLEAGLDPSIKDYKDLDQDACEKYAKYFEPHGISRMWRAVNGNYKLCKLVTDVNSELLSDDVRYDAKRILEKITSLRKYCRKESCKNAENFRKVSFLLMQYELSVILARRDDLWNIL